MPLYDLYCACGYLDERILYGKLPECPECGKTLQMKFPLYAYIKMKGEGGYPSRKKQVFNTTGRNHPLLEKEKNKQYF